ncbi:MAG: hypothetical protein WA948_06155 [Pontixanthobacter sp.]
MSDENQHGWRWTIIAAHRPKKGVLGDARNDKRTQKGLRPRVNRPGEIAEAREPAIDTRRDIQRGIAPIEERKRQKIEVLTFKAAAKKVHTERKATWKNGKHQDRWIKDGRNLSVPQALRQTG